jgi:hypothetical protein
MSDILGWTIAIGLVALLWGAGFWFGSDRATRDARSRRRARDHAS